MLVKAQPSFKINSFALFCPCAAVLVKSDIGRLEAMLKSLMADSAHQDGGGGGSNFSGSAGAGGGSHTQSSGSFGGGGSSTSSRAHWLAICDILRAHVLSLTRLFSDSLRLRSENMRVS